MEFFNTHILTKKIRWILWSVGTLLLALLIYHAGVVAGLHQAMGPRPGEHGFRPPFGAPAGFMLPDGYAPRGHGAVGVIETVTLPTLTITEPDGDVETVYLASTTAIDTPSHSTSTESLLPGTRVIIFGDPDETNERINAKVIHIIVP